MKKPTNTFGHEFGWLRYLAPEFCVDGAKIEILDTPNSFHSRLTQEAKNAKKRIVLAALYLGTGSLEKELIDCIQTAAERNETNLKIDILLDYVRGSRGQTNSKTMLQPLMDQCENSHNLNIALYHTPNLRGVLKKCLPARWNETIGVAHLKAFIFDDTFVISGANLSNDYFVDRQDRYMVFRDCPEVADYFHRLINTISRFSFKLMPNGDVALSSECRHHPFEGNFEGFADDAHSSVRAIIQSSLSPEARKLSEGIDEDSKMKKPTGFPFRALQYPMTIIKSAFGSTGTSESQKPLSPQDTSDKNTDTPSSKLTSNTSTDDERRDTWIYPTIQMGLFGIRQDEIIMEALMKSFPLGSKVSFTTGYFNVTDKYCDVMVKNAANYDILLSSPEANGFFGSHGFGGYIPAVYVHLCQKFHDKVLETGRANDFALFEYIRRGWTFHGKGLWYYPPGESLPNVSLIGSSNFGLRSVNRDLEAQVIVVTKNQKLRSKLHQEKRNLMKHTETITAETLQHSRYHVPRWVALATYFIKRYF